MSNINKNIWSESQCILEESTDSVNANVPKVSKFAENILITNKGKAKCKSFDFHMRDVLRDKEVKLERRGDNLFHTQYNNNMNSFSIHMEYLENKGILKTENEPEK